MCDATCWLLWLPDFYLLNKCSRRERVLSRSIGKAAQKPSSSPVPAAFNRPPSPTSTWSPTGSPANPGPHYGSYSEVMDEPLALIKKPRQQPGIAEEKSRSSTATQIQVTHLNACHVISLKMATITIRAPVIRVPAHRHPVNPNPAGWRASACCRYAILPDSERKCEQWREECINKTKQTALLTHSCAAGTNCRINRQTVSSSGVCQLQRKHSSFPSSHQNTD